MFWPFKRKKRKPIIVGKPFKLLTRKGEYLPFLKYTTVEVLSIDKIGVLFQTTVQTDDAVSVSLRFVYGARIKETVVDGETIIDVVK